MENQEKRVLVGWSGGVDSTGLVNQYLSQGCIVDAVYCVFKNSFGKSNRELAARKAMLDGYFSAWRGYHLHVSEPIVIDLSFSPMAAAGFQQVMPWLLLLHANVLPHHKEVALAYVMNDDAISYLEEIKAIWNSFQGISQFPLPPLIFPFSKTKKENIYRALPAEIRDLTTWCERAEGEDKCGVCTPCRKMIFLGLQEPPPEETKVILTA